MQKWELALESLVPVSSVGKTLLDSLPVAVYTCDMVGRIVFYNATAEKLWGYAPDLSSNTLRYCACSKIFVDGVELSPEKTPMAIALQTGQSFKNLEAIVERPDGSQFYAIVNINPVFDDQGRITGAINVFQDSSDLKAAEMKLRTSEDKYRELVTSLEKTMEEKLQDLRNRSSELYEMEAMYHKMIEEVEDYAIILLDSDGIIRNWNKGAEKIKGYKEAEIVGKTFQEFYLPHDRQSGLPLQLLEYARSTGKAIHEGWRKRKDGSAFWGSIVLTAIHDENGKVIGFSKVTRDLTERKLTEDRVKEYLQQLEFQNKELEQFVYAASHDMREPLRKIHLYNSFVADNEGHLLGAQSRQFLDRSINAANRMNKLIEDLLVYSRATNKTDQHANADLNLIIDEIVAAYQEEATNRPLRIERTNLPLINGVAFQLKQLFVNLIDNAIKYSHPERDILIRIEAELINGDQLPQSNDGEKSYYKISVKDNGIGFEPEYSKKIFEIFQRLIPAVLVKGSGIGLAICKKIMQNHNGLIDAIGVPGKGAELNLYFPCPDQFLQSRSSFSASS
ncbi:MAG: PAS domain S-box protein [Chitinophagaceae bacterium]|nr:PAS domain S-box protein [Chitinophagaceae bacterium]